MRINLFERFFHLVVLVIMAVVLSACVQPAAPSVPPATEAAASVMPATAVAGSVPVVVETSIPLSSAAEEECPAPAVSEPAAMAQPGSVREDGVEDSDGKTIPFQIYLPPGYDQETGTGYPVLYMLHGSNQDERAWFEMGLGEAADRLILSGLVKPFIIVTPRESAVTVPVPESSFGEDLVKNLVPYVDTHYNTCAERDCRAIGGLSRGAQWALRIGLAEWQTFGAIGVHSNPGGHENLSLWLKQMTAEERPRLYVDVGDGDFYREAAFDLEERLMTNAYVHTWVLNAGSHDTAYWRAHAQEYLEWYTLPWRTPE